MSVDEIGVDEMAVDETGVDKPGLIRSIIQQVLFIVDHLLW